MIKNYIFKVFLILLNISGSNAQQLVQVSDEVITVNSSTSLTGYTRNKTEVLLPEKTIGYVYRISVFPKGSVSVGTTLFDLLDAVGGTNISLASSFARFAITNNDSNSIDAFIFNNTYDADNFFSKNDGNWSSCKSLMNRGSCCFATKECLGNKIYFGFRNNNIAQGLDVKIEIVALVDINSTSIYKYSYSINNKTNIELKYFVSLDNVNWQENTLRSGYLQNFSFSQREIYFKIVSNNFNTKAYKLAADERYQLFWNDKELCWDLSRY